MAREAAERARRALPTGVRYRDSRRPGDAEHAARLADHATPPTRRSPTPTARTPVGTWSTCCSTCTRALADVHGPEDGLAAAARVLGRDERTGLDALLGHPAEALELAGHVRAMVEGWLRAAGVYEGRLADSAALPLRLLVAVDRLGKPRRADAIAVRVAADPERIGRALVELRQQGALARGGPAGRRARVGTHRRRPGSACSR